MFVAPTGDLICEFLMADFKPEDFSEFKNTFRVDSAAMSASYGDVQETPLCGVQVKYGTGIAAAQVEGLAEKVLFSTFAYAPYMAARYGVETTTVTLPTIPHNRADIAAQRAAIELQKSLSQTSSFSLTFAYRPWILPNRPVLYLPRTRMGTTVSVNTRIPINGKATVAVGLDNIRTWNGMYRQQQVLNALNSQQKEELKLANMDQTNVRGIDPYADGADIGIDIDELRIYTHIYAGESTPMSARVGWGVDPDPEIAPLFAPAAGIYVLDSVNFSKLISPPQVPVTGNGVSASASETTPIDIGQTLFDFVKTTLERSTELTKFPYNPVDNMSVGVSDDFGAFRQSSRGNHSGIDIRTPVGTPIVAVEDGVVSLSDNTSGGQMVTLKTKNGYTCQYLHLSQRLSLNGQTVSAGTILGATGNTGVSTGPHLHFGVKDPTGNYVDPKKYLPYFSGVPGALPLLNVPENVTLAPTSTKMTPIDEE
jgi:hypothetical protein